MKDWKKKRKAELRSKARCVVCIICLLAVTPVTIFADQLINPQVEDTYINEEYQQYCEAIGAKYNICPELLEAMIEHESGGDPYATGPDGDTGLMQVIPRWHSDRMEKLGVTSLYDPYSNILVATDYLSDLFEQYGDIAMVLMEYNGSSDAEYRWQTGQFTDYANEIMDRSYELERAHGK